MRGIPLCSLIVFGGLGLALVFGVAFTAAGTYLGPESHAAEPARTHPALLTAHPSLPGLLRMPEGGQAPAGTSTYLVALISAGAGFTVVGLFGLWLRRQLVVPLQEAARSIEVGAPMRLRGMAGAVRELRMVEERYNRAREAMKQRIEALDEQLHTDWLTGVSNRRGLEEALLVELDRARRSGAPVSLVFLDLDGFKALNDEQGHESGDRALQQVARLLRRRVREADAVARWGGDEFVILCRDTDLAGGEALAHALARRLAQWPRMPGGCRASIGVSAWQPGEGFRELIARADEAIYDAKRQGGGRVCVRSGR
ncbi:GGDEF domain-containing protein [Halorhodospira sp. 9622]|uniref:GGDEF domain-containing protein n=1 Tax=Halorhodospira sp. 9622 TaxID=2899136 RepID=UPI001EE99C1B|nr:GGDEF domain-containing protein [Halorhodospira sp. 9622]